MIITAVVEIPKGSSYKYEIDKNDGILMLDRIITLNYPHNYGYLPGTLSEDGDATDVFLISDHMIFPLTKVKVKVLGVFKCTDNGVSDDKILAVIDGDMWNSTPSTNSIDRFLQTYKKGFTVDFIAGYEEAERIIQESIKRYQDSLEVKV